MSVRASVTGVRTVSLPRVAARATGAAAAALTPANLAIAAPATVMFGLACWGIGRSSMYGTESVSYWAAHLPGPTLLHVLSHVDVVHGLYYALLHLAFLFGDGTVVLRLPSAFGMAAAIVLVGLLARRLSGSDRVAFFACLWMCTVPFVDGYAQQGRSYALDVAAALFCALMLLRALEAADTDAPRRWLAYGISLTVAGYLHEMTALAIISHGVTLWWARTDRDQFAGWRKTVLGAGLALLPLVIVSALQGGQLGWVRPASLWTFRNIIVNFLGPSPVVITTNAALIAVAVVVGRHRAHRSGEVTLVGFALPLLVLPPVIAITESAITHPLYGGPRYFLYCVGGAALLVGSGADRLVRAVLGRQAGWCGWAAGVALAGVLFAAQLPLQERLRTPHGAPQDMLGLSVYIREHARNGDGIIYAPRSFGAAALAYPDYFRGVRETVRAESPERSGTLYGTEKSPSSIRHAVLAQARIWLVGQALPHRTDRPELTTLEHSFYVVLVRHVTGVRIALYVRDGARGS